MRISVIIFTVLLAQTSASFFSELTSSIYTVQSSIGEFISNAAYDLKDSFDCTVFAVRLAFTGTLDTTLPGYEKCQSNQNIITQSPSRPVQIYTTALDAHTPADVSEKSQPEKNQETISNPTPKSTYTKVNDEKEQSSESELLGETRTLVNMSSKLELEFEDLSKHVNEELTKIEKGETQLTMEKITKEIDTLLEEQINYKNSTESEIREGFDKIISKLDNNSMSKLDLKDEIKSVLAEMEHNQNQTTDTNVERELKIWEEEEELKSLDDVRNQLKKQKQNNTTKPYETSTKVINTMRPIVASFQSTEFMKTARTTKRTKSAISKRTVPPSKATPKTPVVRKSTKKRLKTTKTSTSNPNDYDSLVSEDTSSDLARELVGTSNGKKTESIMASVYKNKKSASSVFDHPE